MVRKQRCDETLEELIGERDHVRIQISLLRDSGRLTDGALKPMHQKLLELEDLIDTRQRAMHGQSL